MGQNKSKFGPTGSTVMSNKDIQLAAKTVATSFKMEISFTDTSYSIIDQTHKILFDDFAFCINMMDLVLCELNISDVSKDNDMKIILSGTYLEPITPYISRNPLVFKKMGKLLKYSRKPVFRRHHLTRQEISLLNRSTLELSYAVFINQQICPEEDLIDD